MGKHEKLVKELTLALLYLSSFNEKYGEEILTRSWKGYSFDILNELVAEDYIYGSRKAKSIYLSDKGIQEAEKLIKKYLSNDV